MKKHTHCGYIIDYDVYKDGEEEQGFTACSVEMAIEIIEEIERDD